MESRPHSKRTGVRFLHAVGRSSFKQGLTIPLHAQTSWLADIRKGESVPVRILYGDNDSVSAVVRRINNKVGHLQFRYEGKAQAPLRRYLLDLFEGVEDREDALIEITEIPDRTFAFRSMRRGPTRPMLSLSSHHTHNLTTSHFIGFPEFAELGEAISQVQYFQSYGQREYNASIGRRLVALGWRKEPRIITEIGLRTDFEKNGLWLEIEFGNARTYYQDYMKFFLAERYRQSKCGVLVCPTSAFAGLLCELGRRRATAKRRQSSERPISYSGMMTYEKALRELPFLDVFLAGRVAIAAIDVNFCDAHHSVSNL